jgi:hypothetical protein
MSYKKAGDAGHSTLCPDEGDFRGDTCWWENPIDAAKQAAERFVSYGHWAGPGNKFDESIQRKCADPSYDPATDPECGRHTAVDGLDAAAREHDLAYYRDNCVKGKDKVSMFSLEGILNTADADRKLQQAAAKEMADPSLGQDGKPVEYSDSTRLYADGMQGFFGGRADGVDIRRDYLDGKIDAADAVGAAATDIGKAYDHNGVFGAINEGLGLANVAGAQAVDSVSSAGAQVVDSVSSAASKVFDWLAN